MRKLPLLLLLAPLPALAQQPAQPPLPSGAPPTSGPLALPPPPEVSDPMLTPVPPPKRVLSSWQEAIADLRARSTDLRISLDQVLQAEAQSRIALAAYLPSINATGVATHNILTKTNTSPGTTTTLVGASPATPGTVGAVPFLVPGPTVPTYFTVPGFPVTSTVPTENYLTGNIQAQQALINIQAFDQISIAELNEDATRLSVDAEKRVLALSVANDIVAVVTAERSAEINRVGLKVALEQVEIATRKRNLGAATGLDVVRAQQNAANARATLVTGDESLREAREALGLALGFPEETGVAPNIDMNGLAESAMSSCKVVQNVDERADIAQARTNLAVAKRNLRNVYFQFLPTLNAQSTAATTGQPVFSSPSTTWNIQAILSVPIWDGGARYGNLRNARAAEDIAAQNLESLRRQAIIQVTQAQRQLLVAQDSYRVALEQRDLAAKNDQMTQTAYMTGQGTSLELVTASEAHRQAELNLALQEFGVVKARILAIMALATCPW
jgi:multidrug efflux system outer membrane protein